MTSNENGQASLTPWCGGAVLGIAAAALCFFAGHEFWPEAPVGRLSSPKALSGQITKPGLLGLSENTIADIAARASDSVVNIDTKTSVMMPEMGGIGAIPFFMGPGGMEPFMFEPSPHKFEQRGTGSGVIFRSDGYILTNNHVVGDAQNITVTLNDKRTFPGKVVGRDSYTDLALIKIDANNLPQINFGTAKNLRPGDWAIAIGSPMHLDHTVTLGIISALNRSLDLNRNVQLIQTDAAINPGNSGGPLLNIHGDVIGINVAIQGNAQNIGFSIPVDVAKDVAAELLAHGTIGRPYLGIYMQELDEKLARSLGLPGNTKGVIIGKVVPGSPAEKSGLSQGDVISKIDGTAVANGKDVQSIVVKHKPGQTLNMLVSREGKLQAVQVQVGTYPGQEQG